MSDMDESINTIISDARKRTLEAELKLGQGKYIYFYFYMNLLFK